MYIDVFRWKITAQFQSNRLGARGVLVLKQENRYYLCVVLHLFWFCTLKLWQNE